MVKNLNLVKDRNFCQKLKFCAKIDFGPNRNFGHKSKASSKIEISDQNWNFAQKSKFRIRPEILRKNRNFGSELIFNDIFFSFSGKKVNCVQKVISLKYFRFYWRRTSHSDVGPNGIFYKLGQKLVHFILIGKISW